MISHELLRAQSLLQGLPGPLVEEIRPHIQMREVEKKDVVLHKGSLGDALLLLFTGRLQVISMSEEGKEVGLNFIEPGDYFGEISLIDGGPRSASVVAVTNSAIGLLPKGRALWLFQNNPLIADRIQKRLCSIIRKEIHYRSNLGSAKAFTRIYSVLFGNTPLQVPKPGEKPLAIENLPSQQSIASMANVSRETVSRAIHALIKNGVLQKDTRRLIIKNPAVLQKLAKGELDPENIPATEVRPRITIQFGPRSGVTPAQVAIQQVGNQDSSNGPFVMRKPQTSTQGD